MSHSRIVLLFATLFIVVNGNNNNNNLATDELSLAALKSYVTSDPKNILKNGWSDSKFVCNWTGVTCGTNPLRVVALNLSFAGLVGTVPPHLGNLSSLIELRLQNNSFGGFLPRELSRLKRLQIINFGFNDLSGAIPAWLGSLPKLQGLGLNRNQFSGWIPTSIFNLTSLRIFDFSNNRLSGSIPEEIGNLGNLQILDLTNNEMSGSLPNSVFNITTIKVIALNSNKFSGNLPKIIRLPNLEELYVAENKLTGSIPESISNATQLTDILMSINHLSGSIPNTLTALKKLKWLSLFNNDLSIESRTLSALATLGNLSYVSLSYNPLNATIPLSIGSNASDSLEQLYMSGCSLRGEIPASIANLSSLIALNLQENGLSGSIQPLIGSLWKLQVLHLNENMLRGPIPSDLCNLQRLFSFNLRQNMLSGPISPCLSNATSLRKLSFASNRFSSKIPSTIWSLRDMLYVDLSFNSLTGALSPDIQNLKVLTHFSVSSNQLSGNISSSIGELKDLTYLWLANNKFQGVIPDSIGKLLSLENLDLSNNNLSGVIPKSMEKLTHLKSLNLSFNDLYGEIPSGGPFSNFSYKSFIRNSNLCGASRLRVPPCKSEPKKTNKALYLRWVIPTSLVAALLLIVTLLIIAFCRKKSKNQDSEAALVSQRRVSKFELSTATNGFKEENLLGAGGFGSVYKGTLSDGLVVAIKVFNLQLEESFESFASECEVLCNVRHRNLVKVITCCSSPDFKALVLQYMPNGSLDKWLYSDGVFLSLLQRLNIMIDVASALEYLHYGYLTPIVHCDLKPSNVLLDENMVAHVADFGMAKLLCGEDSMTQTMTLATIGYMAPEYGVGGVVSRRGDVFSFGVMLMEVFTKKKPIDEMFSEEMNLKQWVQNSIQNESITSDLLRAEDMEYRVNKNCVTSILELALSCSASSPEERIDMKVAVSTLNKIKTSFLEMCYSA